MFEPWERPFEDSDQIDLLMSVILGIAKIVGMPDGANPIEGIDICRVANPRPDDLTPLELAVRGLAERAETVRVVTADRDRRIDPVEHARAVWSGWCWHWAWSHGRLDASACNADWISSPERATLLARVGADVLAIVEES